MVEGGGNAPPAQSRLSDMAVPSIQKSGSTPTDPIRGKSPPPCPYFHAGLPFIFRLFPSECPRPVTGTGTPVCFPDASEKIIQ